VSRLYICRGSWYGSHMTNLIDRALRKLVRGVYAVIERPEYREVLAEQQVGMTLSEAREAAALGLPVRPGVGAGPGAYEDEA
jgi:hypothetical protein